MGLMNSTLHHPTAPNPLHSIGAIDRYLQHLHMYTYSKMSGYVRVCRAFPAPDPNVTKKILEHASPSPFWLGRLMCSIPVDWPEDLARQGLNQEQQQRKLMGVLSGIVRFLRTEKNTWFFRLFDELFPEIWVEGVLTRDMLQQKQQASERRVSIYGTVFTKGMNIRPLYAFVRDDYLIVQHEEEKGSVGFLALCKLPNLSRLELLTCETVGNKVKSRNRASAKKSRKSSQF